MTRNNQKGFAHVMGLLLIVLVVAAGTFVGWRVFSNQNAVTDNGTDQAASQSAQPPQINSSDDLENAETYLNETDIDEQLNTSEIDSTLSE